MGTNLTEFQVDLYSTICFFSFRFFYFSSKFFSVQQVCAGTVAALRFSLMNQSLEVTMQGFLYSLYESLKEGEGEKAENGS